MSRVEQKVGLDVKDYNTGLRKMTQTTKQELARVDSEFNESGNAVQDFSERTKRGTKEASTALEDLAKGFKSSIGALSIAGLGALGGAAIGSQIKEGLDFTSTINQIGSQQGLNQFRRDELRNQLLDVSSARDVEEEDVAGAAKAALDAKASLEEAVKFADIIAAASRTSDDVDPRQLAQDVVDDLRARGEEVSAATAKASIDALLAGAEAGFADVGAALAATSGVEGQVQRRAGLSNRDLIELLGGAQLGVRAAPEETQAAIKELITLTDKTKGNQAQVQGLLGTDFRDAANNFEVTSKDLETVANKLAGIGDEQLQREVLGGTGLSQAGIEGLLSIVRDREGFGQQRGRVAASNADVETSFQSSTRGFGDFVSKQLNAFGNLFKRSGGTEASQNFGLSGQRIGPSEEDIERRRNQRATTGLPSLADVEAQSKKQQGDNVATALPSGKEVIVKTEVEITSRDPGFAGIPKTTDLPREPRGL